LYIRAYNSSYCEYDYVSYAMDFMYFADGIRRRVLNVVFKQLDLFVTENHVQSGVGVAFWYFWVVG